VAGVQDMRFQDLMPDVFHWLGMRRIDRWISMSNLKFEPMRQQGIEIVARVPIPDDLIPLDAQVEMDAKKAAGYYTDETVSKPDDLAKTKGRALEDY
jgi:GTP cyclohydrolase II